jgi:hypothetical protein
MKRTTEARFWQVAGAVVGIGGGAVLAYVSNGYGLAPIEPRALVYVMAAAFMIVAGGAAFLAGRALRVEETRLSPVEATLWKALAAVCILGGVVVIAFAKTQQGAFLLDRMATAMAGAFSVLFGVLCLVGERVMAHMHDVLVVQRQPEEKAQAAGAR